MAPTGRQWFSLADRAPASMAEGVVRAADALNADIDARLAALGLGESDLALVGFSQGTMMSLHVAYRRAAACAGVLGFSGRLVGGERVGDELRVRPPTFLVHGDADDLVPVGALFEAATTLGACEVPVQWHVSRGIGHGIAPDGLQIGGLFLRDVLGGGCARRYGISRCRCRSRAAPRAPRRRDRASHAAPNPRLRPASGPRGDSPPASPRT